MSKTFYKVFAYFYFINTVVSFIVMILDPSRITTKSILLTLVVFILTCAALSGIDPQWGWYQNTWKYILPDITMWEAQHSLAIELSCCRRSISFSTGKKYILFLLYSKYIIDLKDWSMVWSKRIC